MKTKVLNALLIATTILGLISCKKENGDEAKSNKELAIKATLSKGNPKEILAIRSEAENLTREDNGPAVETFYDLTYVNYPHDLHFTFCAWPVTNCLKTVVITPTANKTNNIEQKNKDNYQYEYRGERDVSSDKLLSIIPLLSKYPSFKDKIVEAETVKTKIVTDYKTFTKYLKVYNNTSKGEEIIFAAPVDDKFVNNFDTI